MSQEMSSVLVHLIGLRNHNERRNKEVNNKEII